MSRRILFVRLPHFPTERFIRAQQKTALQKKPWWDEQAWKGEGQDKCRDEKGGGDERKIPHSRSGTPLVLVENGAKGTRISAVEPEAFKLGLRAGMKLADARTMVPNLQVEQADKAADARVLNALAHWMMRYSPAVALHESDGFLLDTTGCDHLLGGEALMAQDIMVRFEKIGFSARLAFTDYVSTSVALVNYGAKPVHILPPGHEPGLLDAFPVEALRVDDDTVTLLKRLGLKTIGDLRPLPRAALERRFYDSATRTTRKVAVSATRAVQWRLDQLNGTIAEPLHTISEPQPFRVSQACPDLALTHEAVGLALENLLPFLCEMLNKAGCGGRHFRLTGYRADGGSGAADVFLSSPTRSPKIIARLFQDRLDQIDCGYGVDLFTLSALGIERFHSGQHSMLDVDAVERNLVSLGGFADILSNKAGQGSVGKLHPCASHVPERAQRLVPVTRPVAWSNWKAIQPFWAPRPLRLFERPEPAEVTAELPDSPPAQFIWRHIRRRVVRARGPECIMPEWWHDNLKSKPSAVFRDYYDVEDTEGLRYWIFRSIRQEQVHCDCETITERQDVDAEEEQPEPELITTISWYVHGLF